MSPRTLLLVVPVAAEMYDELCAGIDVSRVQFQPREDGTHDVVLTRPSVATAAPNDTEVK